MAEADRAWALIGEADALLGQGDARAALAKYESSRARGRSICNEGLAHQVENAVLGRLGLAYNHLGLYSEAATHYEQALIVSRETGDRECEAEDMANLGITYELLGRRVEAIELQTQALGIQTQALADADADADGWATGLDDDTADDSDDAAAAAEDDDGALSRLRRGGFDLAANALHVQQCALSKQMRAAAQPQQHLTAARSHGGAGGARGGGAWDGVDDGVEHGDWGEAGDDDDGGAAAANDTSRSGWSRSAQAIQRAPPSHAREIDGRIEAAINAINQTPAPGMTDYIPLQTIGVVFYDNDDDRHLEEEIEGRDGGLRDHAVADDDGELEEEEAMGRSHFLGLLHELADGEEEKLDDDEDKTVRQDYWAAPSGSSGASGAAASATVRLGQLWRMIDGIDGSFHAERSVDTSVLTLREESPSLPAPDDASATGRTYDDITKPPPPHLRCVVSPLSSLPPVVRCTAASRHLFAAEFPVRRVQAVLFARLPLGCLVLDV